jgi:hypothetical protein
VNSLPVTSSKHWQAFRASSPTFTEEQVKQWLRFQFPGLRVWRWLSSRTLCCAVCRNWLTFQRCLLPPSAGRLLVQLKSSARQTIMS